MSEFTLKWVGNAWRRFFLPTVAIGCVLLLWIVVQATRSASPESESESESQSASLPALVQLNRPELESAAGIEVAPVQSLSIGKSISCNGNATFNQNAYVKVPPKASGTLRKINVDVGSNVRAGDVLAVVNSQAVGDLKASLVNALVHQEHLRWQIEKYKAAVDGVPAKNLFEAQHFLEEQLTDTARINERLTGYGFSEEQIKRIAETKEISIQLPVTAPRGGVVVSRHAVEGEPVDTTTTLFAIADLETMWITLNAYESYLPSIFLGQGVTFKPDGLPGQGFKGTITWISPEVDLQTRTIQLRAEVANRDGALRANMFGTGEIMIDQPQQRLVVPQTAVQSHHGNHVVFVQKPDNLFEVRQIEVGVKNDPFWEVTAGLRSGEKVATTGSFLLKSNLENPDFGKVE